MALNLMALVGLSLGRSGMDPQQSDGGHDGSGFFSNALEKFASNSQIPRGRSLNYMYLHPSNPRVPPLHVAQSLS